MCMARPKISYGEQKATPYTGRFSSLQNRLFKLKHPQQTVSDKNRFETWRSGIAAKTTNNSNVRFTKSEA